jgi:predicted permease
MAMLHAWIRRLWATFGQGRTDRDIEDELRLHLELAAEHERNASGPADPASRRAALRSGGVAQAMESLRDQRGLPWLRDLGRDMQHGWRLLGRSPVFATAAIISLALGIGANTAIFSLVDAVLLRRLPVQEPNRLVQFVRERPPYGRSRISHPLYERFRDDVPGLDGALAEAWLGPRDVSFDGRPETVNLELVSGNYYTVLGVDAAAGRTFSAEADRPAGRHPVAVISDGFWLRRFARDPSAIGRTFVLNQTVFTVVGVTPPDFFGTQAGRSPDVTLPLSMDAAARGSKSWLDVAHYNWLAVVGRLRPGVTPAQAEAQARTVLGRASAEEAAGARREMDRKEILGQTVRLEPAAAGLDDLRRQFSTPLAVLMAVVALVLLLACANLANLLLARAASRRREMAMRLALGASRGRIIRQLLAEGLLLATIGGALGVLLAYWLASGLITMMSNGGPRMTLDVSPDARVLGFATLASMTACLLFSTAPAVQAAFTRETLGSEGVTGRWRLGAALVAVQVAMSVVLLVGAGLFVRTLLHLYTLDAGFTRDGVVLFTVNAPKARYAGDSLRTLQTRIVEGVARLPGVETASLTLMPPVSGGGWDGDVDVEGHVNAPGEDARAHLNAVGPRYFATLGTPVVAGREFTDRDGADGPKVAVVNETFARYYFGDRSPLGRQIALAGPNRDPVEIVGVVKDMKYMSLRQSFPRTVFFALRQSSLVDDARTYVLRTRSSAAGAAGSIDPVLARIDPGLRATEVRSLREHISRSVLQERLLAALTGGFGLLSLVLVAVGVYGVVAFQVGRRTREIGIRMALGALPRQVLAQVLREAAIPVLIGTAVGVVAALQLTRVTTTMLMGVTPTDPATFAGASALLVALGLAAAWLPGRAAAKVNPATTLNS